MHRLTAMVETTVNEARAVRRQIRPGPTFCTWSQATGTQVRIPFYLCLCVSTGPDMPKSDCRLLASFRRLRIKTPVKSGLIFTAKTSDLVSIPHKEAEPTLKRTTRPQSCLCFRYQRTPAQIAQHEYPLYSPGVCLLSLVSRGDNVKWRQSMRFGSLEEASNTGFFVCFPIILT